jgi:hypothetical protein
MSTFKRRMIARYYRPGDEAAGRRAAFAYMLVAEAHPAGGFTVHLTGMNPSPTEGELPAGKMHIRDTDDVVTALLGAQARIDSHHAAFKAASHLVEMRISRKAFDDAQADAGLGGRDVRKQIDDALDNGDPVIITEPDGDESKVGRDDKGKFTFTPIARK